MGDDLSQLINVLNGEMSFVESRPDIPGIADQLEEGDQIILLVKPGIIGPTKIRFRDEEYLLSQ
ncbi:MAG: sugar transferase [Flavobacteriales bacterium AspAUS03]